MTKLRELLDTVLSAFYPERCSVCSEVIDRGDSLCENCRTDIFPLEGDICHKCGVALREHDSSKCRETGAPVIASYYYRGSVRDIIIDFKDTKREKYFEYFAHNFFETIAREYSGIKFDIAVCVPSVNNKKSTSEIICRETAEKFLIGFDKDILEKYRETEKQHRLGMEERFHNLENSIRVHQGKENKVKGKTILLCDDVKTTGSTLGECTKALYEAGAKNVYCACLTVSDYTTTKDIF